MSKLELTRSSRKWMIFQDMDKIEWCNIIFKLGTVDREWRENIIYDCYERYFCINGTFEMRTAYNSESFIQLISWEWLPSFLYQMEIKGERARKQRDRERKCVCMWALMNGSNSVSGKRTVRKYICWNKQNSRHLWMVIN